MINGKYRYVAVIGIDGMGNFNRNTPTPCMDKIFADGAVTYEAISLPPTISAQNWGAMLLGANPAVHGLTNSIVGNRSYDNPQLPSVFARIRRAFPDAYLSAVSNWDPINRGIIEDGIGVHKLTADSDERLLPLILKEVESKPTFLFVQFDDVDGAGHSGTYGQARHLDTITRTDGFVGEIYEAYERAGILDEVLFVVIADHGGIRVGHGGYTDSEKYVFLGVSGKGVEKGKIEFAYTKDIAAIVLYALGIDVPEYDCDGFSSQLPAGIFADGTDYCIPEAVAYNFEPKESPDFFSAEGLSGFVDTDKLRLALFFDESMEDATGKNAAKVRGNIKYYNGGVRGSFAEVGLTGNACYEDVKLGNGSFSVAFWAKIDPSLDGCPAVCSDKDWFWKNSSDKGFTVAFRSADTMLNIADGNGSCEEYITPFPEGCTSGWIHTVIVLDKEKKEYRCYNNFKHQLTIPVDDELICDLDASVFTVGDDAPGKYNSEENKSLLCLDDFLLFGGALSESEIDRLAEYYCM